MSLTILHFSLYNNPVKPARPSTMLGRFAIKIATTPKLSTNVKYQMLLC